MKATLAGIAKADGARCSREGRRIRAFKAQRQGLYRCRTQYAQTATLLPIIREQVKPDSIVYTDCYRAMMCRMSVSLATCASTTVHTLPKGKTTSME